MPMRFLIELLTIIAVCNLTVAQSAQPTAKGSTESSAHLNDFQAIEFRRYTIKEGSEKISWASLGFEVSTRLRLVLW